MPLFNRRRQLPSDQFSRAEGNAMIPRWTRPPERNTYDWIKMFSKSPRLAVVERIASDLSFATGKLYVLRDEAGALCLREIETLKLDLLIDAQSAQTFRYSSSIDRETCNKIKLTCNNPDTGKRELYIAQDGEALNRWGVLQYFETVQSPAGAAARADALLGLYNRKTRTLKVQKAFGDPRVGGGSSVVVLLELDDGVTLSQYMVVEQVVHTFAEGLHQMDLDLIGGNFTT